MMFVIFCKKKNCSFEFIFFLELFIFVLFFESVIVFEFRWKGWGLKRLYGKSILDDEIIYDKIDFFFLLIFGMLLEDFFL